MAFRNRNNNRNRLRGMSKRQGRRGMSQRPGNLPLTSNEALEQQMRDREMMDRMQNEQAMAQGGGQPGQMSFQRRKYNPNAPQRMPNRFGMNRPRPLGGRRRPQTRDALSRKSEGQYAMENANLMSNMRDARNRRPSRRGRTPSRNSRINRGRRY